MKFKIPKIKLTKKLFYNILLYYSTLLSTVLIIGGFYTTEVAEIISSLVFLPIVVFLWMTLVQLTQKRRGAKRERITT